MMIIEARRFRFRLPLWLWPIEDVHATAEGDRCNGCVLVASSSRFRRFRHPLCVLPTRRLSVSTQVVIRWEPNAFVVSQMWNEFTGFDNAKRNSSRSMIREVRTLYPTDRDQFSPTGHGSFGVGRVRNRFQRDGAGRIASLSGTRSAAPRVARRVAIEKREDVRFSSGRRPVDGTLPVRPRGPTSRDRSRARLRPKIGSTCSVVEIPGRRAWPFSVRQARCRRIDLATGTRHRSICLAGDVVAAIEYLKTRRVFDTPRRIGLLA